MKRALPAVPFVVFGISAALLLARLGALGASGTWALTVALEGLTVLGAWGAALGLGRLAARGLLRGSAETFARAPAAGRFALEGGLGVATLMTLCHLLGLAGLLRAPVVAVLLLGGCAAAVVGRDWKELFRRAGEALAQPAVSVAAPLAAVLLVAASFPPGMLWPRENSAYDALEYHLQVPREWLAAGHVAALPHNVYSYLTLNLEVVFTAVFALRGGAYEGMLAAQWLHASFGIATAALLALWAAARTQSPAAGAVAAAVYLAVPWNLVTGSLAYNEQAAAFLGLAAFVILWEGPLSPRALAAAGICAGAAVGTKLTAVGFLLLPAIAATVLLRDREEGAAKAPPRGFALALLAFAAAALLTDAPYLARNAAWTHNPVFPFATRVLGRAHWGETEEWRWINGHFPRATAGQRAEALWRCGPGDPDFGIPWFLVAAAGLGRAFSRRPTRALAGGAAAFAGLQLAFWVFATHLQARFLQPLTVPLALAAGLGAAALPPRAAWPSAAALALGFSLWHGALLGRALDGARPSAAEGLTNPTILADVFDPLRDRHPLLVAEARAFYPPAGSRYADPFEVSPFAKTWRAAAGDPARVLDALRQSGIDLVIVNWEEAARLKATYGLDPEITRDNIAKLVAAGAKRLETSTAGLEFLEVPR